MGGGGVEHRMTLIFNVYSKFEILNTRFSVRVCVCGGGGGTQNDIDF